MTRKGKPGKHRRAGLVKQASGFVKRNAADLVLIAGATEPILADPTIVSDLVTPGPPLTVRLSGAAMSTIQTYRTNIAAPIAGLVGYVLIRKALHQGR